MNRLKLALVAGMFMVTAATPVSIRLIDIAESSGVTAENTSGGRDRKTYILETTGNGAAIFDYDGDGANDIFLANGSTLDAAKHVRRMPQLYFFVNDAESTE